MLWSGFNYRETTVDDIPNHANLNIGDTIISSGNSAIFPDGIAIGEGYFISKEFQEKIFTKLKFNFLRI